MAHKLILEEFFHTNAADAFAPTSSANRPPAAEEQKLASFESGYKAGWDDATKAVAEENAKLSVDLADNLRDLSFSYEEARDHVVTTLEPLLRDMANSVLPKVAQDALPSLIAERMRSVAREAAGKPVFLTVAPGVQSAVEKLLPKDPGFPLEMQEDDTLAAGQAYLRSAHVEEQIDLDDVLSDIQALVADFFATDERLKAHG